MRDIDAALTLCRQICLNSLCILAAVVSELCVSAQSPNASQVDFRSGVLPVLKRNCFRCHGVVKKEGSLQLHSSIRIWKGGESGTVVVPSNPEDSPLWTRVRDHEMPPERPLTDHESRILHDWIAQGAPGLPADAAEAEAMAQDEHWAFTRLITPAIPNVRHPETCRTPVDHFIQSELEKIGLQPCPETDGRRLIRRISFTLTGLPPTPTEIDAFLADESADAVESLIDRYLASDQYGVRWGRHWLDAAGYADSNGYFNADTNRPLAYRYRDYVVRSMNADKPFDQFVCEQIAGDELSGFLPDQHRKAATPEMIDMLVATHFLRNGQDGSGESDGNPDEVRIDRYTALESAQHIVTSSLLGLTLQCAKCHDHKFEPLTQADFYQLQSVLFPAFNLNKWISPNDRFTYASLPGVYEKWEAQLSDTKTELTNLKSQFGDWTRQNRPADLVRVSDDFTSPTQLTNDWSSTIPGDDGPAGVTPVTLLDENSKSPSLPAALASEGRLKIIEGGVSGDKWLSTKQSFDWTPDTEGQWIQVTFALLDTKVRQDEAAAARIGYGIALHDFNNNSPTPGGNLLIDGNPAGGATVHLDYPGPSSTGAGSIGSVGYAAGHTFGVRITHLPESKYRLEHLVDGLPEGRHIDLREEDLPNGSFGFEFCCGRSFQVDDVVLEASYTTSSDGGNSSALKAYQAELQRRQDEIKTLTKKQTELQTREPGRISWMTDSTAEPPDVFLLDRGEYSLPKVKVQPASIAVLHDDDNPLTVVRPANGFPSSGRRLAWANWVTKPGSRAASLMARVQVNRVWQHHFGTGFVSTSENLGMSGSDPSNQTLLDWLAAEFIRSGWSLKSLHRLILKSTVFRQSGLAHDEGLRTDPYNKLWWRYPIRRLDAEAIRDTQLAISGELDPTQEGPYIPTSRNDAAEVILPEDRPGAFRRSVYLQQRRTQGLSLLNVFDAPTMIINCARRPVTTMPLQSLSLLNSDFAVRRGRSFAKRIMNEAGDSAKARIRMAFELATGCVCNDDELEDTMRFLTVQQETYARRSETDQEEAQLRAWSDFCQLLMSSNACLYLE